MKCTNTLSHTHNTCEATVNYFECTSTQASKYQTHKHGAHISTTASIAQTVKMNRRSNGKKRLLKWNRNTRYSFNNGSKWCFDSMQQARAQFHTKCEPKSHFFAELCSKVYARSLHCRLEFYFKAFCAANTNQAPFSMISLNKISYAFSKHAAHIKVAQLEDLEFSSPSSQKFSWNSFFRSKKNKWIGRKTSEKPKQY